MVRPRKFRPRQRQGVTLDQAFWQLSSGPGCTLAEDPPLTREQLRELWEVHRAEVLERWTSRESWQQGRHGNRPWAFWAFDHERDAVTYPDEVDQLRAMGVLTTDELATLAYWAAQTEELAARAAAITDDLPSAAGNGHSVTQKE